MGRGEFAPSDNEINDEESYCAGLSKITTGEAVEMEKAEWVSTQNG